VRLIPWLGLLLVGGCGTGEGRSYILLDEEARAARVEVDVGGRPHAGALPLEVEVGARVAVRGAALAVGGDRLYQVRGAEGTVVERALADEVVPDLVEVAGPREGLETLASALGARVEATGPRWRLRGPDAFVRTAWLGDRPDITAVEPVLAPRVNEAPGTLQAPGNATLPLLVGLYRRGDESLFLDAGGSFLWHRGCDAYRGSYRLAGGQLQLVGPGLVMQVSGDGTLQAADGTFTLRGDQ
jgi:hypothetical protein